MVYEPSFAIILYMGLEIISDMSEDDAQKLMSMVRERLPHHNGRIGSALMEVLEIGIPGAVDEDELNREVFKSAVGIITDDYS